MSEGTKFEGQMTDNQRRELFYKLMRPPDDPFDREVFFGLVERMLSERPDHLVCLQKAWGGKTPYCDECSRWIYPVLEEERRRVALDMAERSLRDGLVSKRPGLPPPSGLGVERLDDATQDKLWMAWNRAALATLDTLVHGVELHGVAFEVVDVCREVTLEFDEVEFAPVLLVKVKATTTLTSCVELVPQDDEWLFEVETPSGKQVQATFQDAGSLGFLPRPITVSHTDMLDVPLAVLEALGNKDFSAPGARPVAIGKRGASWQCCESKFTLPAWLVGLLRSKEIEEALELLGVPEAILGAVQAALSGAGPVHSMDSGRSLSEAESSPFKGDTHALREPTAPGAEPPGGLPSDIREEAIAALRSLPGKGFSVKEARELVAEVCAELPAEASVEEVVRAVLTSLDVR